MWLSASVRTWLSVLLAISFQGQKNVSDKCFHFLVRKREPQSVFDHVNCDNRVTEEYMNILEWMTAW